MGASVEGAVLVSSPLSVTRNASKRADQEPPCKWGRTEAWKLFDSPKH